MTLLPTPGSGLRRAAGCNLRGDLNGLRKGGNGQVLWVVFFWGGVNKGLSSCSFQLTFGLSPEVSLSGQHVCGVGASDLQTECRLPSPEMLR